MKGRKWNVSALLLVCLFSLIALGGCGGGSSNDAVLENWKGTWKSFSSSVSDPSMISVYTEVQKYYQEQYSVKGIEYLFEMTLRTDFDSLKVEGDAVTYLDDKGVAQGTVTYVSRGTRPSGIKEDGKDVMWYLFEASSVSDKTANYKYLVLQEPIKKDDEPQRISMYYGDKGFDALLAGGLWGPAIRPESVPVAPYAEQLKKNAAEFKGWFPAPLALGKWHGTWVNPIRFLDNPLMTPVYEAVSKKAAAKGKTYTLEAVKSFFKETMLRSDFAGGAKVEGNAFTFLDDKGGVKATVSYVFDGIEIRNFMGFPLPWSVFKAEAEGPYKVLALRPAGKDTPDGFTHFHMRYGDKSAEALLDDPALALWWPTLCESTTTAEKFAKDMLDGADEMVGMLP